MLAERTNPAQMAVEPALQPRHRQFSTWFTIRAAAENFLPPSNSNWSGPRWRYSERRGENLGRQSRQQRQVRRTSPKMPKTTGVTVATSGHIEAGGESAAANQTPSMPGVQPVALFKDPPTAGDSLAGKGSLTAWARAIERASEWRCAGLYGRPLVSSQHMPWSQEKTPTGWWVTSRPGVVFAQHTERRRTFGARQREVWRPDFNPAAPRCLRQGQCPHTVCFLHPANPGLLYPAETTGRLTAPTENGARWLTLPKITALSLWLSLGLPSPPTRYPSICPLTETRL